MDKDLFEQLLADACRTLSSSLKNLQKKITSKQFEQMVREALQHKLILHDINVDMAPPAQEFPDIVIGNFGVEVKFSEKDTWRSIANSIFEGRRNEKAEHIYLLFGKTGGTPEARWNKYEDCIMHVRTSHVPRFEVEIGTESPLFPDLGVSYHEFRLLPQAEKMPYIRNYAKGRLKPGERLWWIEDEEDTHTLPLGVQLYTKLSSEEKLLYRAEAALLCPQIVKGSRARGKYDDATMYLLTYRGILCNQARDLFSAGSVAMRSDQTRGGNYLLRALIDIEPLILEAAHNLDDKLFTEYWGQYVPKEERISFWLEQLDSYAVGWVPSKHLFKGLTDLKLKS